MSQVGQLTRITCLLACLFTGCESTQTGNSYSNRGITPSPYSRIGTLTHFDPASATVVVRLDQRDTELSTELFVRNNRLEIVSLLRPTGIRTGNSVGLVVLSGEPAIGMEVVQKMQP